MRYREVLQFCMTSTWCLRADKLAIIVELLAMRVAGRRFTPSQIRARVGDRAPRAQARTVSNEATGKAVAVIPVHGVLSHRISGMENMSGGTSTESLARKFRGAMNDPGIGAVVLDFNSPGGVLGGVPELHAEILAARGRKPIVAQANGLMASAAYWIASAADEIVATTSGEVGSIGAYLIHRDLSAALEKEGIRTTVISAGKFKTEGNPFEPLTEEARAALQARVTEGYESFLKAVSKGRGVPVSKVREGYGEGRAVSAQEALRLGMIDRIATMDETLGRLLSRGNRTSVVQAGPLEGDGDGDDGGEGDEPELAALETHRHASGAILMRQLEQAECSCTEPCGYRHYRIAGQALETLPDPGAAPAGAAAEAAPAPAAEAAPLNAGDHQPDALKAATPVPPQNTAPPEGSHPEVFQRLLDLRRE